MYKVMALDIGTKRIGIALSDYLLILANGHSYISREPDEEALSSIYKIAKEDNVQKIVCGTYSDGETRSIPDAFKGEVYSPKQKGKAKKKKKKKELKKFKI